MREHFVAQARLHPAMQPQDALKLAYQAAFGAEHLLADAESARAYLHRELAECQPDPARPLMEALCADTCRIDLSVWKARGLPEDWLFTLFQVSCVPRAAGERRFMEALCVLDALAQAGELPFPAATWQAAKAEYLARGIRPVHHSEAYRAAERPAYRVVDAFYARVLPLLPVLQHAQAPYVIALDGRCASGKTTLTRLLCDLLGGDAVHMDDFFLPAELRTEERLHTPGGNVHYERFAAEVLPRLRGGQPFVYRRFDCGQMALGEARMIDPSRTLVVEGAYSCHPALGAYMDLRVFSDVAPQEQQRRIIARNGTDGWQKFRERWIPLEEAYFSAYAIRERADYII